MLWTLVLAHLTADYPLQSASLVQAKREWRGLVIHIAIHFAVLMALTLGAWGDALPYVTALTLAHFAIDALKNAVTRRAPGRQVSIYFIDQLFHLVSILLISGWAVRASPGLQLPLAGQWQIYAVGLMLVTYIWFITERIIYHDSETYLAEIEALFVPRMLSRLALMAVFLLAWRTVSGPLTAAAGMPYLWGRYRARALLIDLGVAVGVGLFLAWAL